MDTVGSFTPETIKHWRAIKQAHDSFLEEFLVPDVSSGEVSRAFELWISSEYGIQLILGGSGYCNYEILDQSKYLFFVLKFVK